MQAGCLCLFLLQVGCYVPAAAAELAPVDRVFTRIGGWVGWQVEHISQMVTLYPRSVAGASWRVGWGVARPRCRHK
jgi:hypothetical protein